MVSKTLRQKEKIAAEIVAVALVVVAMFFFVYNEPTITGFSVLDTGGAFTANTSVDLGVNVTSLSLTGSVSGNGRVVVLGGGKVVFDSDDLGNSTSFDSVCVDTCSGVVEFDTLDVVVYGNMLLVVTDVEYGLVGEGEAVGIPLPVVNETGENETNVTVPLPVLNETNVTLPNVSNVSVPVVNVPVLNNTVNETTNNITNKTGPSACGSNGTACVPQANVTVNQSFVSSLPVVDIVGGGFNITNRTDGKFDVLLTTDTGGLGIQSIESKIELFGVAGDVSGKIDAIAENVVSVGIINTVVAGVDASVENATIALEKQGNVDTIFRCDSFDVESFTCSEWVATDISFIDNGDTIEFVVDSFSGYGGGEITIINVQSYPTVGGEWVVEFTTNGTANLTISAIDGTTWDNSLETEDLLFLELNCGGVVETIEWINDTVFIEDYHCNETGSETSKVITPGAHHLQFAYGQSVGFANNFATANTSDSNLTSWDSSDELVVYANYSKIYVNFTNSTGSAINGTGRSCTIEHNRTGVWRELGTMAFNATNSWYEFTGDCGYVTGRGCVPVGNYSVNITCVDSQFVVSNISVVEDVVISEYGTTVTARGVVNSNGVQLIANFTRDTLFPEGFGGINRNEISAVIWNTSDIDTNDNGQSLRFFDFELSGKLDDLVIGTRGTDKIPAYYPNGSLILGTDWPGDEPTYTTNGFRLMDYDQDGYYELVAVASGHSNQLDRFRVYNRTGTMLWQSFQSHYAFDGMRTLEIVDYDLDGLVDDIVGLSARGIWIFTTADGVTWDSVLNISLSGGANDFALLYADNDSVVDFATTTGGGGRAVVYNGSSGFVLFNTSEVMVNSYGTSAYALDDDGIVNDVVMLGYGEVHVFSWNGTNNSIYDQTVPPMDWIQTGLGFDHYDSVVVDFDNDGNAFEIVTGSNNGNMRLYNRSGSIMWASPISGTIGSSMKSDTNADGHPEIYGGGNGESLYAWNISGNRTFFYEIGHGGTGGAIGVYGTGESVQPGDVNSDGILDVAIVSEDGYVHVFQPTICVAVFNDSTRYDFVWNTTTLRWEMNDTKATDSFVPSQYNLTCQKGGYQTSTVTGYAPNLANLSSFDDSDFGTTYANYTKFSVNYTDLLTNEGIPTAQCSIEHNRTGLWRHLGYTSYNATTELSEFIGDCGYLTGHGCIPVGNYSLNITCNSSNSDYQHLSVIEDVVISEYETGLSVTHTYNSSHIRVIADYTKDVSYNGLGGDTGNKIRLVVWNTTDLSAGDATYSGRFIDLDEDGYQDEVAIGDSQNIFAYNETGSRIGDDTWWSEPASATNKLVIFDADGDGFYSNMLYMGGTGIARVFNKSGDMIYSTHDLGQGQMVGVFDYDGDGVQNDLIFNMYNGQNIIYNSTHGFNWTHVWNTSVVASNYGARDILVKDMNHDGVEDFYHTQSNAELVYLTDGTTGVNIWNASGTGNGIFDVDLIDINKDGFEDSVAASGYQRIVIFNKTNSTTIWSVTNLLDDVPELAAIDLDNDGFKSEIISGGQIGSNSGPAVVRAHDNNSNLVWSNVVGGGTDSTVTISQLHIADLKADGLPDAVAGVTDTGILALVNTSDGRVTYLTTINQGSFGVNSGKSNAIDSGDVDKDGILDLAVFSINGYAHIIRPVWCIASFSDGSLYSLTWNITTERWEMNDTKDVSTGLYNYTVSCDKGGYEEQVEMSATPTTMYWNCTTQQDFDTASCWSGGRLPVVGDDLVFNSSGLGDVNVTRNSMVQNLNSITFESTYTGDVWFNALFAKGNWGPSDGSQEINVTKNITFGGGTFYIYGDYIDTTCCNLTNEGHGQIFNSLLGNITVSTAATIDGSGFGFGPSSGPSSATGQGASHGGRGGHTENYPYGNATAPTSLGAGSTLSGGSAIKLFSPNMITIDGTIMMRGAEKTNSAGGTGAGGSIWLEASIISGLGILDVQGGDCNLNNACETGSGGRVRLGYSINLTFAGEIDASSPRAYASTSGTTGKPGTLTFTNNTWPTSWDVNGTFGLLGGNYGETNITQVLGDFRILNNSAVYIYGDCHWGNGSYIPYVCYNTTQDGRGVQINASGVIMVEEAGAIYAEFGFAERVGPGGVNGNGGSYGGFGGGGSPGPRYGSQNQPISLGSGGTDFQHNGASAIKLQTKHQINIYGRVDASSFNATNGNGVFSGDSAGSGGSIWLDGSSIVITGDLSANSGRCNYNACEGGAGGRISVTGEHLVLAGTIAANGGLGDSSPGTTDGDAGTVYINVSTYTGLGKIEAGAFYNSGEGGTINITGNMLTLLGHYNSSGIDADGTINVTYNSCSSSFTGTFDPAPSTESFTCGVDSYWNCTTTNTFNTASCWDTGAVPYSGYNLYFNASGTGEINITQNSMPQWLNSITFENTYTGSAWFNSLFSQGLWGEHDGSQYINVSSNITLDGGTFYVYGDYVNATCCNVTEEGHGQVWRSDNGNIIVGPQVMITGFELGFPAQFGPGRGTGSNHGASHGGYGGGNSALPYGNATAPTSLGSGGEDYKGSASIKLDANSIINISGHFDMGTRFDGSTSRGHGSGGSIWLVADTIVGDGKLNVSGGSNRPGTVAGCGGGGHIRIDYITNITFSGEIKSSGGDCVTSSTHGGAGLFTFTNNIWPADWNVNGSFGLLGGDYGEGSAINVLGSINIPSTSQIHVYGSCRDNAGSPLAYVCYNSTENGEGVWLNASKDITVHEGSVINGFGLGFEPGLGPGAGTTVNDGGSHGGTGGSTASGPYGNENFPVSLGSGGNSRSGGSSIRIETLGNIIFNGSANMSAITIGSSSNGVGAGGSILFIAQNITGNGTLNVDAGSNTLGGSGAAGGGGRIALLASDSINLNGNIKAQGGIAASGSHGGGGTIFINATNSITIGTNSIVNVNGSVAGNITINNSRLTLQGDFYSLGITQNGNTKITYSNCSTESTGDFYPVQINVNQTTCPGPTLVIDSPSIESLFTYTIDIIDFNVSSTTSQSPPLRNCTLSIDGGAQVLLTINGSYDGGNSTQTLTQGRHNATIQCTDTLFDLSESSISVMVDLEAPTYSDIGFELYPKSGIVSFNITASDLLLGSYVFGTNLTGNWVNHSLETLSGNVSYINVTKVINDTIQQGSIYAFIFYINDTTNHMNQTPPQLFYPQDLNVSASHNYSILTFTNDTIFISGTVNYTNMSNATNRNVRIYLDDSLEYNALIETDYLEYHFDSGIKENVTFNGSLTLQNESFVGNFTSRIFDAHANVTWQNITWNATTSSNLTINVSVKACDDPLCSGEEWNATYSVAPQSLTLNQTQHFQYKVEFFTNDTNTTPQLYNVTIIGTNPNSQFTLTDQNGRYDATIQTITLGPHDVYINTTDAFGWIGIASQLYFETWAPTKLINITTINYTQGETTYFEIITQYNRTDTDALLAGNISIVATNTTDVVSKFCTGVTPCTLNLTIGPTGDFRYGNVTINISAINDTAYYEPQNFSYIYFLEEPFTYGNLTTNDVTLAGLLSGTPFSFLHPVVLNNTFHATMTAISIRNTTTNTGDIDTMTEYNSSCTNLEPFGSCAVYFNVTVRADIPEGPYSGATFTANWSNNNDTQGTVQDSFNIIIQGNPQLDLSQGIINVTDNIGFGNTTLVNISNVGTVRLGENGVVGDSVFITYIPTTLPGGWVNFDGDGVEWEDVCGNDCFDRINVVTNATLHITINATNYTNGTFTGQVNISAIKDATFQTQQLINISITIDSNLSVITTLINVTDNIGSGNVTNITIHNAGNAPLSAIKINFTNQSLPRAWVNFTSPHPNYNETNQSFSYVREYTNASFLVNITPTDYTAGTYKGYVDIQSGEYLNASFNVTITNDPQINTTPQTVVFQENLSTILSQLIFIQSIGNTPLTTINVTLTNITTESGWLSIDSNESDWNTTLTTFDRINEYGEKFVNLSLNINNITSGNYTAILNITTAEGLTDIVNITVVVNPNLTIASLNITSEHNRSYNLPFYINNTGNARIVNAQINFSNDTILNEWINLTFAGTTGHSLDIGNITEQTGYVVNVSVDVSKYADPGNYTGQLTITSDNDPTQTVNITVEVLINASWEFVSPINKSGTIKINVGGAGAGNIANITLNNTGNVDLNFSITYNDSYDPGAVGGDLCVDYFCLGFPTNNNPSRIHVPKNSTNLIEFTLRASSQSRTDVGVQFIFENDTANPDRDQMFLVFNVTNDPPELVNFTTLPTNQTEQYTNMTLYAEITDDETVGAATGLNLTSYFFNVTAPNGTVYTYDSGSITRSDLAIEGAEADRDSFTATFTQVFLEGDYVVRFFIEDKSDNIVAANLYNFEVLGNTSLNATGNYINATNITINSGETINVTVNINNSGVAKAVDVNITLQVPNGWSAQTTTIGNITKITTTSTNVSVTVPASVKAGLYAVTPYSQWLQVNGTYENATGFNFNVEVAENPEITVPGILNLTLNHSTSGNVTLQINSTGNIEFLQPRMILTRQTIPANWISFDSAVQLETLSVAAQIENGTHTNATLFYTIPAGAAPSIYYGLINITSDEADYNDDRDKVVNITVNVAIDGSWSVVMIYNNTQFPLNTPGTVANITIVNDGNTNFSFNINYTNYSTTSYFDYPLLFNQSLSVLNTVANPTVVEVNVTTNKTVTIYQNGHNQALDSIGLQITIVNNSAQPDTIQRNISFSITEVAPQIPDIVFPNGEAVEINDPILLKAVATDDSGLNVSTLTFNITYPNSTTLQFNGTVTGENTTFLGEYVRMNFTLNFTATPAAGTYSVVANIIDNSGFSNSSAIEQFTVAGTTTLSPTFNSSTYNITNVTWLEQDTVIVAINVTNNGDATAYGVNVSVNFSSNILSATSVDIGNLTAGSSYSTNLTITASAQTWPEVFGFTPNITWEEANGTTISFYGNSSQIAVDSVKMTTFTLYPLNITVEHGLTNTSIVEINSTGNDNATSVLLFLDNVNSNFTTAFNQTSLGTINAGEKKRVILTTNPALTTPNETYTFNIEVQNDGAGTSDNREINATVPSNTSFIPSTTDLTINAVSSQNAQNTEIELQHIGNRPIDFTFFLSGQVVDLSIMNLLEAATTLNPNNNYSIQLNYTALVENSQRTGTLRVDDGPTNTFIDITFNSYIATLAIHNISPETDVIDGDLVNITTVLNFQSTNITANTTYTILINGTSCEINSNSTFGNLTITSCTAPVAGDALFHSVKVTANYTADFGTVQLIETNVTGVFYKDGTPPTIVTEELNDVELDQNISLSANVTDNIEVDSLIFQLLAPDSTYINFTAVNHSGEYQAWINTSLNLSTLGEYNITYIANDTSGNVNATLTQTFEVYDELQLNGTLTDLEDNVIVTKFVFESPTFQKTFSANQTGYYNATVRTGTYNMTANFSRFRFRVQDVEFINRSSDFIDLDLLGQSDVTLIGAITGFAINGNFSKNGYIEMDYAGLSITTEDNLRVYQCQDWSYATRECGGTWWQQMPATIKTVSNLINGTIVAISNDSSAFILAELSQTEDPELTVPDSAITITTQHGTIQNKSIQVQSTGGAALSNTYGRCISGHVCDNFEISSNNITSLQIGGTADINLSVTVPSNYAPGNYTGTFMIMSGILSDSVSVTVQILINKSLLPSVTETIIEVGSEEIGTFGQLELNNSGNVQLNVTLRTNSTNISTLENNVTIDAREEASVNITYIAHRTIGPHTYFIETNFTEPQNKTVNVTLNVTHVTTIDVISPSTNVTEGDLIRINASANYLGVDLQADVVWSATVDGVSCANASYAYNDSIWQFNCTAPEMTDNVTHTIKLAGLFQNKYAYHSQPIFYKDVYPPTIRNYTESTAYNPLNVTSIFADILDDHNLSAATGSIITPSGSTLSPDMSFTNRTVTMNATFTELGDHQLYFTLTDTLSNSQTLNKTFEVFKAINFSGEVTLGNGSVLKEITFTLYRFIGDDPLVISPNSSGQYNATIHNRIYELLEIEAFDSTIALDYVNVSNLSNNFDMDEVNVETIAVPNTGDEIMGIAVETVANNSGYIQFNYNATLVTDPADLNVYKCENWSFTDGECNNVYWNATATELGTNFIKVNISGFSAYVVAEADLPTFVVGDGVCSQDAGETVTNSPDDCEGVEAGGGTTTIISSSGGGGGGGASIARIRDLLEEFAAEVEEIPNLQITPKEIKREVYAGQTSLTRLFFKNKGETEISVQLQPSQELINIVRFNKNQFVLEANEEEVIDVNLIIPEDAQGVSYGIIKITSGEFEARVPVELEHQVTAEQNPSIRIIPIQNQVRPGDPIKIQAEIKHPRQFTQDFNLKLELIETRQNVLYNTTTYEYTLSSNLVEIVDLYVPHNTVADDYFVRATLTWEDTQGPHETTDTAPVQVIDPILERVPLFLNKQILFAKLWHILVALVSIIFATVAYYKIEKYRESKKRYHVPYEQRFLQKPSRRAAFIGNLAETNVRSFFDIDKLTTHMLVAGSTGGGKTISAQVIVEEALKKNVAVVVFDPTAQWTGFLRACKDKQMLSAYHKFSLRHKNAQSFNGNVHLVTDARERIKIKDFAKPGHIEIFALNQMNLKDIDIFVTNTVQQIFGSNYEESKQLKMLLVYDEVHRLLPKYGGSGAGMIQIERAAREFRKWGIGLVLVSQVLSDFVGEIKANINTEIQVRTRDEGDLERLKTKYGDEILKTVVKAKTGTGMVQNSAYNKGRPYIVEFRPILHSTKRLSDKELKKYHDYNERIADIKDQMRQLKDLKVDLFDFDIELNLAVNKLKSGDFGVVDIYIDGLETRLDTMWKEKRKKPKKRVKELVSEKEISEAIKRAEREHKKALKSFKSEEENYQNESTDEEPENETKQEEDNKQKTIQKKGKRKKVKQVEDEEDTEEVEEIEESEKLKKKRTTLKTRSKKKVSKTPNNKSSAKDILKLYQQVKKLSKGQTTSKVRLKLLDLKGDIELAQAKKDINRLKQIKEVLEELKERFS